MLGTFLEKATSLISRQFLLGWWFPTFIATCSGLLFWEWVHGEDVWPPQMFMQWQNDGIYAQSLELLSFLLLVTIFSYFLQVFTLPIVRLYEGYWPLKFLQWYTENMCVKATWEQLKSDRKAARGKPEMTFHYSLLHEKLFYEYPKDPDHLLPTRLGNIIRAAEDYSEDTYGMNGNFWWPRLWPQLPNKVRQEIEDPLTMMVTMLNFAALMAILAPICLLLNYLIYNGTIIWWRALVGFVGGLAVAFVAYQGSLSPAKNYGLQIRVAVDLYRFDLLKALHQKLPKTIDKECALWEALFYWIYLNDVTKLNELNMRYDHKVGKEKK